MASDFTLADCLRTPSVQPCWDCIKACGGCSWSARFEPVPGWEAKVRYMSYNGRKKNGENWKLKTYSIKYCPEFEPEVPRDATCY